jgi:hypothetical protein
VNYRLIYTKVASHLDDLILPLETFTTAINKQHTVVYFPRAQGKLFFNWENKNSNFFSTSLIVFKY